MLGLELFGHSTSADLVDVDMSLAYQTTQEESLGRFVIRFSDQFLGPLITNRDCRAPHRQQRHPKKECRLQCMFHSNIYDTEQTT